MVRDTDLADLVETMLSGDDRIAEVTEVAEGIFGVTYNGVGYSVTVTETQ